MPRAGGAGAETLAMTRGRAGGSWLLLAMLLGAAYLLMRLWGVPADWLASASRIVQIGRELAADGGQPDLLQAWSPVCVANVSYVLLSMPAEASFHMGAAAGVDACLEVGIVDRHQLALCRGRGPARFPLTVRDGSRSQRYVVDLAACNGNQPALQRPSSVTAPPPASPAAVRTPPP